MNLVMSVMDYVIVPDNPVVRAAVEVTSVAAIASSDTFASVISWTNHLFFLAFLYF
jgi:hypothetical protein